jgi:hypothetical protein
LLFSLDVPAFDSCTSVVIFCISSPCQGHLRDPLSAPHCITLRAVYSVELRTRIIINSYVRRICKEVFQSCLKVVSKHWHCSMENLYENCLPVRDRKSNFLKPLQTQFTQTKCNMNFKRLVLVHIQGRNYKCSSSNLYQPALTFGNTSF